MIVITYDCYVINPLTLCCVVWKCNSDRHFINFRNLCLLYY